MSAKGLIIGFSFLLPYHVMRCAAAAGISVHVLGNGSSAGLTRSRYCKGYHRSNFSYDTPDYEHAAEEIRQLVKRERFDVVLPSDDVSTRLLAAVKYDIGVRTSAVPSLACFDALNDKWNFTRLCAARQIRVPASTLYDNVDELRSDIYAGRLALPVTVKPTNRSGAIGVHHILGDQDVKVLEQIDYSPILAQRFIKGRDVGINVICDRGEVVFCAMQERMTGSFRLFHDDDLLENVRNMVDLAGLHGPANIDAILEEDSGLGYILECNPRFWYTIYMSMVLGLNFVQMSLALDAVVRGQIPLATGQHVRLNKALFRGALKPWSQSPADWRMLRYHLSDPVPYFCEKKGVYQWEDRPVSVRHQLMQLQRLPTEAACA